MHRLSNGTQVSEFPKPASVIGTPGYATSGVIGSQAPSDIDPDTFNTHQEEIAGVVEAAGIDLDKGNNGQLLQALKVLFGSYDELKAEITRAKQAEGTLQTNISDEAKTRANADNTIQGNITSEATTRANADVVLQSQINNKIGTTLIDDGTNSAVTIMSLLDADNTIWVGTAKSGSMALVKSQPASGFYKILNLTTDTNGYLIVPDSSGRTLTYAHGSSGKIAASGNLLGGYYVRNGNVLRQVFTYAANYGDFIHFPTEYAEAPVVHVTAAAYGGMATTANISGSPVYNGFTFISSVYAGDPNRLENTGTNTISVMVEGLVNS